MSLRDLFKEKPPAVTSSSDIPWPSAEKSVNVAPSSERQPFLTTSPLWNIKRSPSFREFLNPNYKSKLHTQNVDIGEEPIDLLSNLKDSGLSKAELLESTKKTVKTPKQSFKISSSQSHSTKPTNKQYSGSLLNNKETVSSKSELDSLRPNNKNSQQSPSNDLLPNLTNSGPRKLEKNNFIDKAPIQSERILRSQSKQLQENDQKATPKTTKAPVISKASSTKVNKDKEVKTMQSFSLKSNPQERSKPSQSFTTTKPEMGNVTSSLISDIISGIVKDKSPQKETKTSEEKSSISLDFKEQKILQRGSLDENLVSKTADNDDSSIGVVQKKTSALEGNAAFSQKKMKRKQRIFASELMSSNKAENEFDSSINKKDLDITPKNTNLTSYITADVPLSANKVESKSSTVSCKTSENLGTKRKLKELEENISKSVDSSDVLSPKKKALTCIYSAFSSGSLAEIPSDSIKDSVGSSQDQNLTGIEEIVNSSNTTDTHQQHDSNDLCQKGKSNDNPSIYSKVESNQDNKCTKNGDIAHNTTESSDGKLSRTSEYSFQGPKPSETNNTEPPNMAKKMCLAKDNSPSEDKYSSGDKTFESVKMGIDVSKDENETELGSMSDREKASDIINSDVDNCDFKANDIGDNAGIENNNDLKDSTLKVNDTGNDDDDNDSDNDITDISFASIGNTEGSNNTKKHLMGIKNDDEDDDSDDNITDKNFASFLNTKASNDTKILHISNSNDIKRNDSKSSSSESSTDDDNDDNSDDDIKGKNSASFCNTEGDNDTKILHISNSNDIKNKNRKSGARESLSDEDTDGDCNTKSFDNEKLDDSLEVLVFNDDSEDMLEDGEIQWDDSDDDDLNEEPEKRGEGNQIKTKNKRKRKRKRKGKEKAKKIQKTSYSKGTKQKWEDSTRPFPGKFKEMKKYQNDSRQDARDMLSVGEPSNGKITKHFDSKVKEEDEEEQGYSLLSSLSNSAIDVTVAASEKELIKKKTRGGQVSANKRKKLQKRMNSYLSRRAKDMQQARQREPAPRPVCHYYLKGSCTKGDECPFRHEGTPTKQQEVCKYYLVDVCMKGDNCPYLHSSFPCKYFHSGYGSCRNGDHCRFSHDPLTPETQGMLDKFLLDQKARESEREAQKQERQDHQPDMETKELAVPCSPLDNALDGKSLQNKSSPITEPIYSVRYGPLPENNNLPCDVLEVESPSIQDDKKEISKAVYLVPGMYSEPNKEA